MSGSGGYVGRGYNAIIIVRRTSEPERDKKGLPPESREPGDCNGGRHGVRTCDLFRVKEALFH